MIWWIVIYNRDYWTFFNEYWFLIHQFTTNMQHGSCPGPWNTWQHFWRFYAAEIHSSAARTYQKWYIFEERFANRPSGRSWLQLASVEVADQYQLTQYRKPCTFTRIPRAWTLMVSSVAGKSNIILNQHNIFVYNLLYIRMLLITRHRLNKILKSYLWTFI